MIGPFLIEKALTVTMEIIDDCFVLELHIQCFIALQLLVICIVVSDVFSKLNCHSYILILTYLVAFKLRVGKLKSYFGSYYNIIEASSTHN